jgi:hypothetical protein
MELSAPAMMDLMYGFWVPGRTYLSLSNFRSASTWVALVMDVPHGNGGQKETDKVNLILPDVWLEPTLHNVNDPSHYE